MKIAVDVDEVLFEFVAHYLEFLKKEGLTIIPFEEITSYNFWEIFGITKEENKKFIEKYISSKIFDSASHVDGSIEGLDYLRKHHEIYFITARPAELKEKTLLFLQKAFAIDEPHILFSSEISKIGKTKDVLCKELGIDTIIEDNGPHSLSYAKAGLKVYLLDKPWNQDIEHENIIRCSHWSEVITKLKWLEHEA